MDLIKLNSLIIVNTKKLKPSTKEEYKELQKKLASRVLVLPDEQPHVFHPNELIFSLDVQYDGDDAYVAVDIQEWGGRVIGQFLYQTKAEVPYIPGLFSFREGAVLAPAIKALIKNWQMMPSLLLVDGHGTAHPRKFGVACWLGIELNVPSIGCAKEPLIKYEGNLGNDRGDELALRQGKEVIGLVLRTQKDVKPVYVSAGHQTSQAAAAEIVLHLASKYRICEPIRRADHTARRFAKGEFEAGMIQFEY